MRIHFQKKLQQLWTNQEQEPFGLWAKYTWQICNKSSMLLITPKLDKVLNVRLNLWAIQWTPIENGA
jgi:hypothetical protein